jgi:hypothetical protein
VVIFLEFLPERMQNVIHDPEINHRLEGQSLATKRTYLVRSCLPLL